ncbi:hypothetical protein CF70_022645 [Cupriavidus sp. SK-3]|uniref:DUF4189 domain-containing protein n=1 Tax=Cupriavidus sp. SK-3 TaxID=1470558 RepID=UPI00044C773C|nr:DUF4189 domain-containing protein [Cupriavidus sp. SK-3]KDP83914.1 hypothetical protein CF70_022645 [Cupriavidus sp. SK-3]
MKYWKAVMAGVMSAVVSGQAFGWGATAIGDGNLHYTQYNADTPKEAEQRAMSGCAERTTNCKLAMEHAVRSTAMVMVVGDEGWAQVSNENPDKAGNDALASCGKLSKGCRVESAVWDTSPFFAALAIGKDNLWVTTGASSLEAAEKSATERCQQGSATKAPCSPNKDFTTNTHAFYVLASSDDYTGIGLRTTPAQAKKAALESCEEGNKSGKPCVAGAPIENEAPVAAPATMKKWIDAAAKSTAPRQMKPIKTAATTRSTNVVRCSNTCANGSCLRTFGNGRQERWQAPRVYDPITRNWTWDTVTNACGVI